MTGAEDLSDPILARLRGVSTIDGLLESVTLDVHQAAFTVVYGPAGAGKSALVDMLRLAKKPHKGALNVLGRDHIKMNGDQRAKLKRRIGVIPQAPTLAEHLSALDNVVLPLRLAGQKPAEFERDVSELFSYLGLTILDDRPVSYLSGSERRRIATARAVVMRPDILIADEPCAGLAPEAAGRVLKLLMQVRKGGAAVVVLTQDEDLAASLPGRHWRMADGRLSAFEPAAEVAA